VGLAGAGVALAPDTVVKALGAAVSLAFGAVALLGGPSRRANQCLSLFFPLIAGNQAAEAAGSFAWHSGRPDDLWFHLAAACAALDPLMLYAFAALHPRRNALGDPWKLGLVAAGSGTFLVCAPAWPTPAPPPISWFPAPSSRPWCASRAAWRRGSRAGPAQAACPWSPFASASSMAPRAPWRPCAARRAWRTTACERRSAGKTPNGSPRVAPLAR
jgi:hypothetical protein